MPSRVPRFQLVFLIFTIGFIASEVWSGSQQSTSVPPQAIISILPRPIEFFGWFGKKPLAVEDSHTQVQAEYRKLLICDAQCPDLIDIVYCLENRGSQPADLMVLAVGEFRIPSYKQRVNMGKEFLEPAHLVERQNIGQQVIYKLNPGEVKEIKFTNLNIKAEMEKYLRREQGHHLQPWEFRVSINVKAMEDQQVAQGEAVLNLIPKK
jgi:hypothetical protein